MNTEILGASDVYGGRRSTGEFEERCIESGDEQPEAFGILLADTTRSNEGSVVQDGLGLAEGGGAVCSAIMFHRDSPHVIVSLVQSYRDVRNRFLNVHPIMTEFDTTR